MWCPGKILGKRQAKMKIVFDGVINGFLTNEYGRNHSERVPVARKWNQ